MKRNFYWAVVLMTALFSFQAFDIPPARNAVNPKTCCGRAVCMCSHAKGARCHFRHGAHSGHSGEVKNTVPRQGINFTKAPCASHAPKTTLPGYSKDFVFPALNHDFNLRPLDFIPVPAPRCFASPREQGIERPPRVLPFFF